MPKYILKELPEEMTDGKKRIYPKIENYMMHSYDEVLKHMQDYGPFKEGTIRGVFDTFVETMKAWMPMGHPLKIDGLGVFTLSLGFDESYPSERAEQAEASAADTKSGKEPKSKYCHVCIKGINFKPDAALISKMNRESTFERSEPDIRKARKSGYSLEQRIAIAHDIISRNGFMTLSDYAIATGQSRTAASIDLKDLTSDPNSGITTRGSHSHKVWIKL